jgi:hypothetical protein
MDPRLAKQYTPKVCPNKTAVQRHR